MAYTDSGTEIRLLFIDSGETPVEIAAGPMKFQGRVLYA